MTSEYVACIFFGCLLAGVLVDEMDDWFIMEQQKEIELLVARPTSALIEKYGYPARVHRLTTDDDYILELHRIPFGVESPEESNKPVVFLQHGLFGSSADWVMMGPSKDLAYMLADLGYDVWLGNSRGNVYSRTHETLQANTTSYWDFSFHEMGTHDLPAEIDYVLGKTGQEKLFYIGHSQGTTQFFVMASERPEYNNKIKAMFSLAPMAFMDHTENPLMQVLALVLRGGDDDAKQAAQVLPDLVGSSKFAPSQELYSMIGQDKCNETALTTLMCTNMLFLTAGYGSLQLNKTMIPVMLGHTPMGVSNKQLLHYAQEVNSGLFRQFDYRQDNREHYAQLDPPEYDLRKITCPVALYYSSSDWMVHPKDVHRLYDRLVNPIGKVLVPLESFSHLDFLWGIDAKTLLYDDIVELMEMYDQTSDL